MIYNNALKYICPCLAPALYTLDPPVETAISRRLNDSNNDTCLALTEVDHYTFDAGSGDWLPHPRNDHIKYASHALYVELSVLKCLNKINGVHLHCLTSKWGIRGTRN